MVRQVLVFFILFTSTGFYLISFVPKGIRLPIFFATAFFLALAVIIWAIYEKKQGFKRNFNFEIILFLLATVSGMIGANIGHGQNFFLSIWANNYMYFYFLYFFLHMVKLRPHQVEKILIILAIIYLALFFIQYIIYPTIITSARIALERGTVRIFLPGGAIALFIFFYFLQKSLSENSLRYGIYCVLYLMVPILMGTRNAIATILFGTVVFILFNKYVRSRLGIIFLTGFAALLFFVIFQDIIMNLVEVSSNQAAQEGDDIRLRSATYYLTDFYPVKLNYLIGNGTSHMRSAYGLKIMYYKANYGFFQSDLGILNGYIKFGVLFVIACFLVLRKLFIIKVHPKYGFIKFWAVVLLIQTIISYPFTIASSIAAISTVLYLIDVSNYETNYETKT